MKIKSKFIVLVSATVLTLPVWATDPNGDQVARDRDTAQQQSMPRLGDLKRSSEIIGREIMDAHDQRIGKVEDLALDLQNGRIAEVIITTGGTMGLGERHVAVPPGVLACDRTMKDLRYTADKNFLATAPEFKSSRWQDATDYGSIRETYQRFGVEPYFTHDRAMPQANYLGTSQHAVENYYAFNGDNALPRMGYIVRGSRLMGTTALNLLGERLGKINNLVVDLPAGRVVEVIVSSGGFLGMNEELRAVPPEAFQWNSANTALTLDNTSEEFKAMPHFKPSEWGYATSPSSIAALYNTYHVQPYFVTTDMDTGAQNVREPMPYNDKSIVTPLDQSNKSDQDITDKVRRSIQADARIQSVDGKNVKIMTVDGNVTLIGPVPSDDEKRFVGEAAAKVVSTGKVDNQLEVHATPLYATPPAQDSTGSTK